MDLTKFMPSDNLAAELARLGIGREEAAIMARGAVIDELRRARWDWLCVTYTTLTATLSEDLAISIDLAFQYTEHLFKTVNDDTVQMLRSETGDPRRV